MSDLSTERINGNALVLAAATDFVATLVLEVAGNEVATSINENSVTRQTLRAMSLAKIRANLAQRERQTHVG